MLAESLKTILRLSKAVEASKVSAPIYFLNPVKGYSLVIDLSDLQTPADRVSNFCSIEVPINMKYIDFDLRIVLREVAKRPDWTLSSFKDCFPDLFEATGYLSSLKLRDLENHLLGSPTAKVKKLK